MIGASWLGLEAVHLQVSEGLGLANLVSELTSFPLLPGAHDLGAQLGFSSGLDVYFITSGP